MIYTKDLSLTNFNFWSGAKQHNFKYSELEYLEDCISNLYPTTAPSETDINDLFWFEQEFLCDCIGVNFNEYLKR
tara:strand:- start:2 stop:226 length:225 start_codon:yes stop_codon:yes gene_type:complete